LFRHERLSTGHDPFTVSAFHLSFCFIDVPSLESVFAEEAVHGSEASDTLGAEPFITLDALLLLVTIENILFFPAACAAPRLI